MPEPYLFVRGGATRLSTHGYKHVKVWAPKDVCPKKASNYHSKLPAIVHVLRMRHLQTLVSFLLATNGKKIHCRDSPANNSIFLSFYFVLFSEQMENPLKGEEPQVCSQCVPHMFSMTFSSSQWVPNSIMVLSLPYGLLILLIVLPSHLSRGPKRDLQIETYFYSEGGSKISVYFSIIFPCVLGQLKWLIATQKKTNKPWEALPTN